MTKVYAPNTHGVTGISGGHTFFRNLKKGLANKVHFVNSWPECDVFFISGVTITLPHEVHEASRAGKKIVFRVDNVPRKSRNRRSTPHERMVEFANLADVVVYQSEWAKDYCYPLCGDGTVIYNGVDQSVFKPGKNPKPNRYLFAYHGNNDHKNFWRAHLEFQYIFRQDPDAEFWFIYDFRSQLSELALGNYDFWQGEKFAHLDKAESAEDMVEIMQQCGKLIYPAICDASPNLVLEARACGLEVIAPAPKDLAGTQELLDLKDISLERMCDEYNGIFELLANDTSI